jgi:hypothetical protein
MSGNEVPGNKNPTEAIHPRDTNVFDVVKQILSDAARRALAVAPELDAVAFLTAWKPPLTEAVGLPKAIVVGDGPLTTAQVASLSRLTVTFLHQEIDFLEKRLSEAKDRLKETDASIPAVSASTD